MSFWSSQSGPRWDGDARGDASQRDIGELVCPSCQNVLGRLLEDEDGVALRGWVPAQAVGDPGGRDAGFQLYVVITDGLPADGDEEVMSCWRGHGGLWVDGGLCRTAIERYRRTGKRVRFAARTHDDGVSSNP